MVNESVRRCLAHYRNSAPAAALGGEVPMGAKVAAETHDGCFVFGTLVSLPASGEDDDVTIQKASGGIAVSVPRRKTVRFDWIDLKDDVIALAQHECLQKFRSLVARCAVQSVLYGCERGPAVQNDAALDAAFFNETGLVSKLNGLKICRHNGADAWTDFSLLGGIHIQRRDPQRRLSATTVGCTRMYHKASSEVLAQQLWKRAGADKQTIGQRHNGRTYVVYGSGYYCLRVPTLNSAWSRPSLALRAHSPPREALRWLWQIFVATGAIQNVVVVVFHEEMANFGLHSDGDAGARWRRLAQAQQIAAADARDEKGHGATDDVLEECQRKHFERRMGDTVPGFDISRLSRAVKAQRATEDHAGLAFVLLHGDPSTYTSTATPLIPPMFRRGSGYATALAFQRRHEVRPGSSRNSEWQMPYGPLDKFDDGTNTALMMGDRLAGTFPDIEDALRGLPAAARKGQRGTVNPVDLLHRATNAPGNARDVCMDKARVIISTRFTVDKEAVKEAAKISNKNARLIGLASVENFYHTAGRAARRAKTVDNSPAMHSVVRRMHVDWRHAFGVDTTEDESRWCLRGMHTTKAVACTFPMLRTVPATRKALRSDVLFPGTAKRVREWLPNNALRKEVVQTVDKLRRFGRLFKPVRKFDKVAKLKIGAGVLGCVEGLVAGPGQAAEVVNLSPDLVPPFLLCLALRCVGRKGGEGIAPGKCTTGAERFAKRMDRLDHLRKNRRPYGVSSASLGNLSDAESSEDDESSQEDRENSHWLQGVMCKHILLPAFHREAAIQLAACLASGLQSRLRAPFAVEQFFNRCAELVDVSFEDNEASVERASEFRTTLKHVLEYAQRSRFVKCVEAACAVQEEFAGADCKHLLQVQRLAAAGKAFDSPAESASPGKYERTLKTAVMLRLPRGARVVRNSRASRTGPTGEIFETAYAETMGANYKAMLAMREQKSPAIGLVACSGHVARAALEHAKELANSGGYLEARALREVQDGIKLMRSRHGTPHPGHGVSGMKRTGLLSLGEIFAVSVAGQDESVADFFVAGIGANPEAQLSSRGKNSLEFLHVFGRQPARGGARFACMFPHGGAKPAPRFPNVDGDAACLAQMWIRQCRDARLFPAKVGASCTTGTWGLFHVPRWVRGTSPLEFYRHTGPKGPGYDFDEEEAQAACAVTTVASFQRAASQSSGVPRVTAVARLPGYPKDIAVSRSGKLVYVAATSQILLMDLATGEITPIAGSAEGGNRDGVGSNAAFTDAKSLALSPEEDVLYVGDGGNLLGSVRRISLQDNMRVTTIVGGYDPDAEIDDRTYPFPALETVDGDGTGATIGSPDAMAVSADGKVLFVASGEAMNIRRIALDDHMRVTTIAGRGSQSGVSIRRPTGLALSPCGRKLYVSKALWEEQEDMDDAGNGIQTGILAIDLESLQTTQISARGNMGIAVSRDGDKLYFVDPRTIHYVSLSSGSEGAMSLVAGAGNDNVGSCDGPGNLATFSYLEKCTLAPDGSLYVTDSESIRKITFQGAPNDSSVSAQLSDDAMSEDPPDGIENASAGSDDGEGDGANARGGDGGENDSDETDYSEGGSENDSGETDYSEDDETASDEDLAPLLHPHPGSLAFTKAFVALGAGMDPPAGGTLETDATNAAVAAMHQGFRPRQRDRLQAQAVAVFVSMFMLSDREHSNATDRRRALLPHLSGLLRLFSACLHLTARTGPGTAARGNGPQRLDLRRALDQLGNGSDSGGAALALHFSSYQQMWTWIQQRTSEVRRGEFCSPYWDVFQMQGLSIAASRDNPFYGWDRQLEGFCEAFAGLPVQHGVVSFTECSAVLRGAYTRPPVLGGKLLHMLTLGFLASLGLVTGPDPASFCITQRSGSVRAVQQLFDLEEPSMVAARSEIEAICRQLAGTNAQTVENCLCKLRCLQRRLRALVRREQQEGGDNELEHYHDALTSVNRLMLPPARAPGQGS
jgi:DNA-binding beta-propeller fold protein YncE